MKSFLILLGFLIAGYVLVMALAYFFQEKLIFLPQKLDREHKFLFNQEFEERFIELKDGKMLHGLLFTTEDPKGIILYFHGNAGSLDGWGGVAPTFTTLGYDIFIPDYRGYGKSEGTVQGETQLYEDMQRVYDQIKEEYNKDEIIILGHSVGSGIAAKLAVDNSPKLLILQAPFYSLQDLANQTPPLNIFPSFLFKYKFEVGEYLKIAKLPVVILHGDEDEVIYYGSSLKLQKEFKLGDTLITLSGFGHNNFIGSRKYEEEMGKVLKKY